MEESKFDEKLKNSSLIISAGMPRSGSTLLFNILREILSSKWPGQVSAGWISDLLELPERNIYLVKVHNFSPYFRTRANHAFYTYRDVRVAQVSRSKKFNHTPSIKSIRSDLNQYLVAKKFCDQVIKYEDLISNPKHFVQTIARLIGITVDPKDIVNKAFYLQPPETQETKGGYSRQTLLHKNHFTYTKNHEWRSFFTKRLQRDINNEFSWWFKECGYPID